MAKATTYDIVGNKEGKPFNRNSRAVSSNLGVSPSFGTRSPTTRPHFLTAFPPNGSGIPLPATSTRRCIPSVGDAYPYPLKALLLYMGTPVYCLAGRPQTGGDSLRPQKDSADHRLGHRHRRNQHVRRLHLPGPDLPGTLGVFRVAPLGHPQGGAFPAAGLGAPDRQRSPCTARRCPCPWNPWCWVWPKN